MNEEAQRGFVVDTIRLLLLSAADKLARPPLLQSKR